MKRKIRSDAGVGILFLVLLILVMIVSIFTPKQLYSTAEKRTLEKKPTFTMTSFLNGTYQTTYENFVNDQFIARKTWTEMKTDTNILLGAKKIDDVYVLKDMLVQEFTGCNEQDIDRRVNSINAFVDKYQGIKSSFILVPNKIGIYEDQMPMFSNIVSQQPIIDKFTYRLNDAILYPNVSKVFLQHQDEQLYYKTDHHWTSVAAKHIFDDWLIQQGLENKRITYTASILSSNFVGSLANKISYSKFNDDLEVFLPDNDTTKYVVTYEENKQVPSVYNSKEVTQDPYNVFLGGNHPIIKIDTNVETDRNIIIFKDSFANCFIPFLIPYYNQITVIDPRYYIGDVEKLMDENNFTDMLFLNNVNTYFSNDSLEELLSQ